ncbi:MAG: hypothetical protein J5590_08310 [Clostridia bacterium]|nr:hypothetical protein [Clostridia bacterium]
MDFKFINDIPEGVGISSFKTQKFIKHVTEKCPLMRAFMLIRDNIVAAEGYFKPFDYKTEFKGETLRGAAGKILSGGRSEGAEAICTDGNTVFIFLSGAPVEDGVMAEIKSGLSELSSEKDKIDCAVMDSYEKLLLYLSELKTPLPGSDREEESEKTYGGKVYSLSQNAQGIEWARLSWGDKTVALRFKDKSGEKEVYIGRGEYRKFSFAEPAADGYAAGYWENPDCYAVVIDFIGNRTGGMKLTFGFDGDKIKISAANSDEAEFVFEGAVSK